MQVYVRTISDGQGNAVLLTLTLVLAVSFPARTQAAPLRAAEQDAANFAFATQLGSGLYEVSGRDVQIYRLPFAWRVSSGDEYPEIRILFPITFGFFDFEPGDLLDEGLPSGFDTLSFTPGIEIGMNLGKGWTLWPAAQIGRVWEGEGAVDSVIGIVELRALKESRRANGLRQFQARLGYTRVDFDEQPQSGDLLFLELAGEARRDIAWRPLEIDLDVGAYALLQWFADRPDAPVASTADGEDYATMQFEFGVTLGASGDREVWGMPLPRIGVGYRVGEGLSVWRIVVGAAF